MGVYTKGGVKRQVASASIQEASAGDGTTLVSANVRYVVPYTPAAGLITPHAADAILLSVDGTATVVMDEDDGATPQTVPLRGMVWHGMSVSAVTAATASVFLGWFRKPI